MKRTVLTIAVLTLAALSAACGTPGRTVTNHHFEPVHVPPHLYECETLARSEIKSNPLLNSDVHRLFEIVISKNGRCKANINAIRKIIEEHNKTVEELNKKT